MYVFVRRIIRARAVQPASRKEDSPEKSLVAAAGKRERRLRQRTRGKPARAATHGKKLGSCCYRLAIIWRINCGRARARSSRSSSVPGQMIRWPHEEVDFLHARPGTRVSCSLCLTVQSAISMLKPAQDRAQFQSGHRTARPSLRRGLASRLEREPWTQDKTRLTTCCHCCSG